MLPKPDKNKKTFPSGEVIETKEEILAKEKKRLQKKRRFIIISVILTVGLSLSFWTYRSIKNFLNQPHKFGLNLPLNIPNINISKSKNNNFDHQIQKLISSDFQNISLYIADDSDNQFIWQQNESKIFQNQSIEEIKSKINSLTPTDKSLLNISLPVGLTFQEIISDKTDFNYFSQINLPGKKLLILINLDKKQDISHLVESIYWIYAQHLNSN
ncbi:MAG: hypothetical protein PHX34_03385 [Candidatus Shapirobacteria bacterium]|nr:hypothetical protein [Candidatus Shapirobacteria bacterium]